MNKQRMLKLADFLDNLPAKKFDFAIFRTIACDAPYVAPESCGAVGCAIGWMPTVFPRVCKEWVAFKTKNGYTLKNQGFFTPAAKVLDLATDHCEDLFSPGVPVKGLNPRSLSEQTTPKAVAKRIRQFVEKYPTSKFTE